MSFLYLLSYESTITAQFFGHTHYDEFQIFYDTSDLGRALSIAYVGPSISPYYDLNPGYRIYYIDGDHPKTTRVNKMIFSFLISMINKYADFSRTVCDIPFSYMYIKGLFIIFKLTRTF